MAHRPQPKRTKRVRGGQKDTDRSLPAGRNGFLDTLRGLAIVLMVVDHVAGLILNLTIQDSHIRFLTRLSMPLFCVLMGYFLRPGESFADRMKRQIVPIAKNRLVQIAASAVLVNLVFWPHYQRIEILGTLLLAYLLFLFLGHFFPILVGAILFYSVDPLAPWFDYPPTIVISFVAQGMILRRFGIPAALLTGALLSIGAFAIHDLQPSGVNHKLCLFLLPATLLVYLGESLPHKRLFPLDWIGRYPLTLYVAQYYLIFALKAVVAP